MSMIQYFETHIEDTCNLKCRGCSHFSGLVKKARPKDLGEFEKEFARISEIEDVRTIRLMGGEPLVNPRFMEYLRIARKYFPDTHLVLVTNGLLLERLIPHREELARLEIDVTMSDYHLDRQDRSILRSMPISEAHEKGMLYNISLDLEGMQDPQRAFDFCDLHQNSWYFLRDGRFYPCCVAGCIKDFWEHFDLDFGFTQEDLGIDIFTHSAEEIEEFLLQPIKLCRFCDTEERQRSYMPFGTSKGEIAEWLKSI